MKIRHAFAVAIAFAVTLAGGCVDAETEQACRSDQDCLGERICTSNGECVQPEKSEQGAQDDAGPDADDVPDSTTPDIDMPIGLDAGSGGHEGDAHVDSGASEDITGEVECPEALPRARLARQNNARWHSPVFEASVLESVELDASESTGDISRYEWTILERPSGSTQRLAPDAGAERVRLYLDEVGSYRIQLRVTVEGAQGSCSSDAIMRVEGVVGGDVAVYLTWDTPADHDQTDDHGSDLDLHYLHPNGDWNAPPWDIFWRNPTAEWGTGGSRDDPSLAADDSDGAGPEQLNHDNLENLRYRIGVYYYDDKGLGASYATVRIYIHGALEYEASMVHLAESGLFLDVASIKWPSADIVVKLNKTTGFPHNP